MIPLVELTVRSCNGTPSTACGYVAIVGTDTDESGKFKIVNLVAYVTGTLGTVDEIDFDGATFVVFSQKDLPSTCSTKLSAFRIILSGCDTCTGQLFTGVTPADCDDDSEAVGAGTAVNFSARHLSTATKVINDSVTHLETYELMFEGRPNLNSDNIVTGCSKSFKIKSIENKDDIRKPLRAVAEVTPFPRATV